jgi:hypothetical protein
MVTLAYSVCRIREWSYAEAEVRRKDDWGIESAGITEPA